MAISTRELYIIFRARDEASRVIKAFSRNLIKHNDEALARQKKAQRDLTRGAALIGIGAGISAAGAAALKFYADATKAAMTYNQQAAKTLTQVDQIGVSLEQIKRIGVTVASVIPVPFEETQTALYDIFSSMSVTVKESEHLLTEFSKAAVAGQVDLQAASRATIGILNAYNLPARKVNEVNDIMFQLVRKGVGTYDEFAKTIGRAVPSAVRAGQSFKDLAGMMAFLTRNGLSTAMAAASAGRALDALSNPKTVARLSDFGGTVEEALGTETARKLGIAEDAMIKVTDASGKFRPVSAIMTDLGKALKGLNTKQVAAVMQELLKGSGGTIQARRFFDVAIRNFKQLNSLTGDMKKSSGALQGAYDIMFKQPQTQLVKLNNLFQIFKVQIGEALIPVVMKLVQWGSKLLTWYNNLPGPVKKTIAIIGALTAAITLVIGVVTVLAGIFIVLSAAATLLGVGLGTVAIVVGVVIAAIVALGIIVFLIVKYHNQIWQFIQSTWDTIINFFVAVWHTIYNIFMTAWDAIWAFVKSVIEAGIAFIQAIWNNEVVQFFVAVYTTLFEIWKQFWLIIFTLVKTIFGFIVVFIRNTWQVISSWLQARWEYLVGVAKGVWDLIKRHIITPMQAVYDLITGRIIGPLINWLNERWQRLRETVMTAWDAIKKAIIEPLQEAVEGVRQLIENITSKITSFRDRVVNIANGIRDALNHLNPLNRDSPSLVQQTKWGFDALHSVMRAGLSRVDRLTYDRSFAIQGTITDIARNTQAMGMASVGSASSDRPIDQKIIVYTNEIDPARHAALLGLELGRK